jgi:hypothetical protein
MTLGEEAPHLGQGSSAAESVVFVHSSNVRPHCGQRYSYMGIRQKSGFGFSGFAYALFQPLGATLTATGKFFFSFNFFVRHTVLLKMSECYAACFSRCDCCRYPLSLTAQANAYRYLYHSLKMCNRRKSIARH